MENFTGSPPKPRAPPVPLEPEPESEPVPKCPKCGEQLLELPNFGLHLQPPGLLECFNLNCDYTVHGAWLDAIENLALAKVSGYSPTQELEA